MLNERGPRGVQVERGKRGSDPGPEANQETQKLRAQEKPHTLDNDNNADFVEGDGHTLETRVEGIKDTEIAFNFLEGKYDFALQKHLDFNNLSHEERKKNYALLEDIAADILAMKSGRTDLTHDQIFELDVMYSEIMGDDSVEGIIEFAEPDFNGELGEEDMIFEGDYQMSENAQRIIQSKGEYAVHKGETRKSSKDVVFYRFDSKAFNFFGNDSKKAEEYMRIIEDLDRLEQDEITLQAKKGHSFRQRTGKTYAVLMEGTPEFEERLQSPDSVQKTPEERNRLMLELDTLAKFDRENYYENMRDLLSVRSGMKLTELRFLKEAAENDSEVAEYFEQKKQEFVDRVNLEVAIRAKEISALFKDASDAEMVSEDGRTIAEHRNMDVDEYRSYLLNEMRHLNSQMFDVKNSINSFEIITGQQVRMNYVDSFAARSLKDMSNTLNLIDYENFEEEYAEVEAGLVGKSEAEKRKALGEFIGSYLQNAAGDYYVTQPVEVSTDYVIPSKEVFEGRIAIRNKYAEESDTYSRIKNTLSAQLEAGGTRFSKLTNSFEDLGSLGLALQTGRESGSFDDQIIDDLHEIGFISDDFYEKYNRNDRLSEQDLSELLSARDALQRKHAEINEEMRQAILDFENANRLIIPANVEQSRATA